LVSNSEKPILLLASTGFIIRNLLLGKFSEQILSAGKKLVVAVPDPDDPKLSLMFTGKKVEFIKYPVRYIRARNELHSYTLLHTYLYAFKEVVKDTRSLAIQTKLYGKSRSILTRVMDAVLHTAGRAMKVTGVYPSFERYYLKKFERLSFTAEWENIIRAVDPSVVFTTMLSHSHKYTPSNDLYPYLAARKLKIPTVTLVQSWDNLSSKVSIIPGDLTWYYTWSTYMTTELLKYFPEVPVNKVEVVGSPQFDYHNDSALLLSREGFLKAFGLDPTRPYLLAGTGTERGMPDEPEKVILLAERLQKELPEMQVLIRLHPKDHGKRWKALDDRIKKLGLVIQYTAPDKHMDEGGFLPPKEFYRDQVNAIYHSAVVINSSSTLTIDAAILNKPVICFAYDLAPDPKFPEGRSLAYSRSNHYSGIVDTGGVWVVRSEDECVKAIRDYLHNPQLDADGRKKIEKLVTENCDGHAGVRLANSVMQIIETA
jgi:hypothetical protein